MMDRWVWPTRKCKFVYKKDKQVICLLLFFEGFGSSTVPHYPPHSPPSLATLNPNFIHSLFLSLSVWLVRKFVFPFLGVDFLNDISGFDCKFQMITCHTMNKKKDVRYYMDLWIIVRGKSKANHRKFINRLNTLMIKQLDYLKDKYMETIEERCSMIHDLH